MSVLWTLLLFSGLLAGALLFLLSAAAGVRRGRIYYEPSCPPVEFALQPARFVLLVVLHLGLGLMLCWGAGTEGLRLWAMI